MEPHPIDETVGAMNRESNRTTIGVPKESAPGERRVALVPDVVRRLGDAVEVVVEPGAGAGALIPDELYESAGARLSADAWGCDVVRQGRAADARRGRPAARGRGPDRVPGRRGRRALAARRRHRVRAWRRSRGSAAPGEDALSSQSTLAGYKAVLLAAEHATRLLPMMTTAAGTLPPARVLVLGAGVAGLQALATAHRLGARTTGYDVRPETAEQIRSVGADWLDLGIEAAGESGYARELTDAERAAPAAGADRRDQDASTSSSRPRWSRAGPRRAW